MNQFRRSLLLAPIALAVLGRSAVAQAVSLQDISTYLTNISTASGTFRQSNADGTISTGRIYIKRPGRIRFEYDPPERSLVVAGGGAVAIFDGRSNEGPQRFPIGQTPLGLILGRKVDLTQSDMVTDVRTAGGHTLVTAQDPAHPEYGAITLAFTNAPLDLVEWVMVDGAGGQTRIELANMEYGGSISDSLFNLIAITEQWGRG